MKRSYKTANFKKPPLDLRPRVAATMAVYDGQDWRGDVMKTRLRPTTFIHALAMHEAAHAVVAVALGLTFVKVDIIPHHKLDLNGALWWPRKFWNELRIDNNHPYVVSLVERRMVTGLAGPASQRRFAKSSDHWSSAGDRKNVDCWLQPLIGGSLVPNDPFARDEAIEPFPDDSSWAPASYRRLDRKTLSTYHAKHRARATALVDQFWPEIKVVVRALLARKMLSCAAVRKLVTDARRHCATKGVDSNA
jgi:hypothetical protein